MKHFLTLSPISSILFSLLCFGYLSAADANAQTTRADFNGDGFDDLAIGIPNAAIGAVVGAGAVQVLYGSATGLTATGNRFISQSTSGVPGASDTNDHFGAALTAGDFNRDGFDDLIVGTPFEDFTSGLFNDYDAGAFTIIPGSASGVTGTGSSLRSPADVSFHVRGDDEYYGAGLAVGDITLDGTDDLVVTGSGEDLQSFFAGIVTSGLPSGDTATYLNEGLTLAVGDFNGDSVGDVALGAPSDSGSVLVLATQGGNSILSDPQTLRLFDTTVVAGDHFSASLTTCDFDNDGFSDLAVGVPDKDDGSKTNAGAVSIYFGRSSGVIEVLPVRRLVRTGSTTVTTVAGDRYGASVAAGDVNGDSFCDLVVGAPGRDVSGHADAGSAWVIYGSAGRFADSATVQEINQNTSFAIKGASIRGVSATGDRYGSSVATGDFNGDNFADVVVGVPGEDSGVGYGAVNVIHGGSSGLVAPGNQLWQQGSDGLPGVTQSGASFGAALLGSATQSSTTPGLSGFWSKESAGCTNRSGSPRCVARAELRVTNPGAKGTRRSSVKVYRSADRILDADDKLLSQRFLDKLRPGESQTFEFQTRGSRNSIVGARFIAVIDPENNVEEADEENNTVFSRQLR